MHTSKATVLNFESRMENVVMNVTYSKDDYTPKKLSGLTIGRRGKEKRENRFFIQLQGKSISEDPKFDVYKTWKAYFIFLY